MKNYELSDFTWVILVALGGLLLLCGVMTPDTFGQWCMTTALLCVFEMVAFFTWEWTGLYDPNLDRVKTDEESKIVPMDYVKFLLGMRL